MINGYQELNQNINQTIHLIQDIQNASQEQLLGIEQINDAVTQLDQQTQQNAAVASQTQDIAEITDQIAKLIVSNADAKEFEGKNNIKAREIKTNSVTKNITPKKEVKRHETKHTTSKSNEEEWENF